MTADHGNADDMVQRHKKSKQGVRASGRERDGREKDLDTSSNGCFFTHLFFFLLNKKNSLPQTLSSTTAGEPLTDDEGKPLPLTSHTLAPVPIAVGGSGLPADIKFREDLPDAGLANVTGTYMNLLGFATPEHMVPSLI